MAGQDPVEVPIDRLSHDALQGVIDDFVLREGTDYGHDEIALADKRQDVLRQLCAGKIVIMFDPETQTCTIVPRANG